MMAEIFRFLNSYHHDHTVENVWIQNRGSMFLGGISYQELAYNPEYLDKLYKMTVMIAKLNKPIFSFVKGGVRNVGAYVLSMASVALTDHSSTMRIDEVSKGFVPVAGGSHRLSRLPLNVGYFLALTGKRLNSNEMSRLGLITAVAK
jgi:enoyl-CoA hydratase/carnithine racemase